MFDRSSLLKLLLGASLGWAAITVDAQTVNKTFTNQPLKTVLKEIESQTGMSVIYKTDEVNENKKITVTLTNSSVNDALSKVLDSSLNVSHRPTPSAEHLHCRDAIVFSKFSMK
jgi:type II secretory pathway component HofQ